MTDESTAIEVVEPLLCDSCGKNMMSMELGYACIGASIKVSCLLGAEVPFMQLQLGSYKLDKTYNVCWECYLKSLGVKP